MKVYTIVSNIEKEAYLIKDGVREVDERIKLFLNEGEDQGNLEECEGDPELKFKSNLLFSELREKLNSFCEGKEIFSIVFVEEC